MGEHAQHRLRSIILLAALLGLPAWAIVGNPWDASPGEAPAPRRLAADPPAGQEPASSLAEPVEPAALQPWAEADVAQTAFTEDSATSPRALPPSPVPTPADEYAQRAAQGAYRWQEIQHRLRELGATYYLLETWGPGGEQFRFHCQLAVAGNPSYARSFEAVGQSALDAMEEVLQQVEHWRQGSAP